VYREMPPSEGRESRARFTALGSARNSAVFTRASPVQTFATYGAVGMWHPLDDANEATGSLFWLPLDHCLNSVQALAQQPLVRRLDSKYSLFAYVVQGGEVLPLLRAGDVVIGTTVEPGLWQLVPAPAVAPPPD